MMELREAWTGLSKQQAILQVKRIREKWSRIRSRSVSPLLSNETMIYADERKFQQTRATKKQPRNYTLRALMISFIPLPAMKYSTMGKKEPSKLGLHSNVWFRVASCLISGLFTIAIKIADHLRGSRLCLISIHRPDEFTSFQIVSYLHCKFTLGDSLSTFFSRRSKL